MRSGGLKRGLSVTRARMSRTCYKGGMTMEVDTIVLAAANGMSLAEIATAQGIAVSEVRAIIDQEAARCFAGEELRRAWLLEARRLRELGQKYYSKAMGDGE